MYEIRKCKFQVEKRKQEEKMKRDQLNDAVLEFAEKQRRYFKTVKDFQEVSASYLIAYLPNPVLR